jgi:hypothetical protein
MFGRIASQLLAFAAIAGVFGQIPIVSDWAFWFMVGAYLLWLGVNRLVRFRRFRPMLMLTLLLTIAAIVGVFVEIWIVSTYAFWIMAAAYVIIVAAPTSSAAEIRASGSQSSWQLQILVDLYPLDCSSARSDWQAQFCGPLVTFGLTKRQLLLLEFGKLSLNVALMLLARRPNVQRLTHVLSPMAPSHLFNIVAGAKLAQPV